MKTNLNKVIAAVATLLLLNCARTKEPPPFDPVVPSCKSLIENATADGVPLNLSGGLSCSCSAADLEPSVEDKEKQLIVIGTNSYHYSSDICLAARHKNLLMPGQAGGVVVVMPGRQCSYFQGSLANGITSQSVDSSGTEETFYFYTAGATQPDCDTKPATVTSCQATTISWPTATGSLNCTGTLTLAQINDVQSAKDEEGGVQGQATFKCMTGGSWVIQASPAATCVEDNTAPVLSSKTPADDSTNIGETPDLEFNFNEPVKAGTGKIHLYLASDNSLVYEKSASELQFNSASVTLVNNSLPTPRFTLNFETDYYVKIDADAILDLAGNAFLGITDSSTLNFKTKSDSTGPIMVSAIPANDASDVATNTKYFEINFDEPIKKPLSGKIVLMKKVTSGTTDVAVKTFTLSDNSIKADTGDKTITLEIKPDTFKLATLTEYYFLMERGVIFDNKSNTNLGLGGTAPQSYSFTTKDDIAPSIVTKTPINGDDQVSLYPTFSLKFDGEIKFASPAFGTLKIYKTGVETPVITKNLGVDSDVVINEIGEGNWFLMFAVSEPLENHTNYCLTIDDKSITDTSGNIFVGITKDTGTKYCFTTVDNQRPELLSSVPADNYTTFEVDANIELYFNESVQKGNGNASIEVWESGPKGGKIYDTLKISDARITLPIIGGKTKKVIVDFNKTLVDGKQYYLKIDSAAIKDLNNKYYVGISSPTTLNFTAEDAHGPQLVSSSPADDARNILKTTRKLVLNFDEKVAKNITGNKYLKIYEINTGELDTKKCEVKTASDRVLVQSNEKTVEINLPNNCFLDNKQYYVKIDAGAFFDKNNPNNTFAGINNKSDLNFWTTDTLKPMLVPAQCTPKTGGNNVLVTTNLTLKFSEEVRAGISTAKIKVIKKKKNMVKFAFMMTSDKVSFPLADKKAVNVQLEPGNLDPNTEYYVEIEAGVVEDLTGLRNLADTTSLHFKTGN